MSVVLHPFESTCINWHRFLLRFDRNKKAHLQELKNFHLCAHTKDAKALANHDHDCSDGLVPSLTAFLRRVGLLPSFSLAPTLVLALSNTTVPLGDCARGRRGGNIDAAAVSRPTDLPLEKGVLLLLVAGPGRASRTFLLRRCEWSLFFLVGVREPRNPTSHSQVGRPFWRQPSYYHITCLSVTRWVDRRHGPSPRTLRILASVEKQSKRHGSRLYHRPGSLTYYKRLDAREYPRPLALDCLSWVGGEDVYTHAHIDRERESHTTGYRVRSFVFRCYCYWSTPQNQGRPKRRQGKTGLLDNSSLRSTTSCCYDKFFLFFF